MVACLGCSLRADRGPALEHRANEERAGEEGERVQQRVLAGGFGPSRLARDVRAQGEQALARLERGLGRYASKRR